jgi:hypothetical protein
MRTSENAHSTHSVNKIVVAANAVRAHRARRIATVRPSAFVASLSSRGRSGRSRCHPTSGTHGAETIFRATNPTPAVHDLYTNAGKSESVRASTA